MLDFLDTTDSYPNQHGSPPSRKNTMQLYEYDVVVTCHTQPAEFIIPSGATELSILPLTKAPFVIDELTYQNGATFNRTWRTLGDCVVITGCKLIRLEAGTSLHVSYTSLTPLEPLSIFSPFLDLQSATPDSRLPTQQANLQEASLHLLANSLALSIASDPLTQFPLL